MEEDNMTKWFNKRWNDKDKKMIMNDKRIGRSIQFCFWESSSSSSKWRRKIWWKKNKDDSIKDDNERDVHEDELMVIK